LTEVIARVELVLVRHGETEWSRSGRHTGRTDIPLDAHGLKQAEAVRAALAGWRFVRVLTSPSGRAVETCRLAALGAEAETDDDLFEWDYGAYEGRTTAEIRQERPGWTLWRDGVPRGETVEQVGARADHFLAGLADVDGTVAVFAHGHILRVLAARWLGLEPVAGSLFALDPATVSVLDHEHEQRVLRHWNDRCGV
jgi:broad specificity phosphatase PhoE